jgi:hypothetical protein
VRKVPGDHETEQHRNRVTLAMVAAVMATIVVVGLVLGNVLLGDDDPPPPRRGTTTTTLGPRAAVEQAYKAFNAMVVRLGAAPDPDDHEIGQRATGTTRTTYVKALTDLRARGTVLRVGPEDRQTVLSTAVHGPTATMSVCYVGQSGEYDAATGKAIAPVKTTTTPLSVTMTREDGAWKVSRVRFVGEPTEGVSTCGR